MKFNKWDTLSNEEKVAQVRREVEAGASEDGIVSNTSSSFNTRPKPRDWEEAMNELADERADLWTALNNLCSLWTLEAPMDAIENSVNRAREVLTRTAIPQEG